MKIYICADIEGTCGFTVPTEDNWTGGDKWYPYFAAQMSREVAAAVRGAFAAGAEEVLVHDSHLTSRNIDPSVLPRGTKLMRGGPGDPYAMLAGAKENGSEAVMLTGFHAGVGSAGNPSSHTFNRRTEALSINGEPLSEFLSDAYTAAYLGLPVPFVSGDAKVCADAERHIPGVVTMPVETGFGGSTVSIHPEEAVEGIERGVQRILSGEWRACMAKLPETLEMEMRFNTHQQAFFNSFYPGIRQTDDKTLRYTAKDWWDMLIMVHFVLDK